MFITASESIFWLMFSISVISIGERNTATRRDAKLGVVARAALAYRPQRIPAFPEEAPPEPPLFGCASACPNLYHIRTGLGIRNANSGCGMCRSQQTIALTKRRKNSLYRITGAYCQVWNPARNYHHRRCLPHPSPLPQIPPITGNHPLVPPEGFLARAGEGAVAVVVAVDVNQAVAFAHFSG